ncbi:MAG: FAD-dependent pyridine nucleotide-disulfide oxidoreductase [Frankiales bacterium]|nr:FAD-dependent pyridine nucleotide-disulfide oxidoreductase [Frankiales bacterium]
MTITAGTAPAPLPDRTRVLVVGTGFAGLGTAIQLRRHGRLDFLVLERGHDVGGTWRDNTYPGCACDVPSHLYSFSFAPNPDWTRTFSPQPEIQAYLQRTARESGVLPHVRFGTELLSAHFDDASSTWTVETTRGTVVADVLVLGTGGLSEPKAPDLPGLDGFTGTTFHSATWDHHHDLTGERVAVIGTGASAIQFVPHVQRHAAHLTLFQRTAPWVLPRRDRGISRLERRLYRAVPAAQRLNRLGLYASRESWLVGFTMQTRLMAVAERIATRQLARQVPDPVLRDRLTPRFRLGCKRVLLSNAYYPALSQPNAQVVTDRIVEVTPTAVVSEAADGTRTPHEVDTIIYGTGFQVTDPPVAHRVHGRDGRTLAQVWADSGMAAHHGVTIAGFPNLFLLVGPNTGLGHNSIVYMIESQIAYVLDALEKSEQQGVAAFEPRQDVQDAWNDDLQERLQGTVWNAGGCSSWYLDRSGRNTTLWPTFTLPYRRTLASFDLEQYDTTPLRTEVAA